MRRYGIRARDVTTSHHHERPTAPNFFFLFSAATPETTSHHHERPTAPNFFFLFSAAPLETTSHHQERPTDLFSDLDPPRPATTKERPKAWLSSQICNHRGHAVKHRPPRREARTTTPRSTDHLAVPIPTVWRWWSLPISTVVFGWSDLRWFLVQICTAVSYFWC